MPLSIQGRRFGMTLMKFIIFFILETIDGITGEFFAPNFLSDRPSGQE